MARHVPARELHLGKEGGGGRDLLDATAVVKDGLNALPGFKTSAAFFTSLRANLVLLPTSTTYSAMSSNTSTPLLTPSNSQNLPPPSPSPLSTASSPSLLAANSDSAPPSDLSSIPPLTTYTLTSRDERRAGLKLIADSVAQQRQLASTALIYHPLTLAVWVLFLALIYQYFYRVPGDIGIVVTTGGGMTMALLVAVRMFTGPYLSFAEEMTWDYLTNPETGEDDIVIGSKFGDEIIAALVLRLEGTAGAAGPATAGSGGKKKNKAPKTPKNGKAIIRAWTTRIRYRHKGVGTGLLEEAVRIAREQLGRDAEVGFAADHANARMVLPEMLNGGFRAREQRAIRLLEEVVAGDGSEAGRKK